MKDKQNKIKSMKDLEEEITINGNTTQFQRIIKHHKAPCSQVQTNTTNSVNGEIHDDSNDSGNGDDNTVLSGLSIKEREKEKATGCESNGEQESNADDNTAVSGLTAPKTLATSDHATENTVAHVTTECDNQQDKMSKDQMNKGEIFWKGGVN
eukprot:15361912-Ditylum_brightwellii.AAC.1